MNKKRALRLRTAAAVLTTVMSVSLAGLALWKLGPEANCSSIQSQRTSTFLRMSVGGSLAREIRKNREDLIGNMPYSGDFVLSVTVKVNNRGIAEIESAKAMVPGAPETEMDVTARVRGIVKLRSMRKFSDSAFNVRETFDFPMHKG